MEVSVINSGPAGRAAAAWTPGGIGSHPTRPPHTPGPAKQVDPRTAVGPGHPHGVGRLRASRTASTTTRRVTRAVSALPGRPGWCPPRVPVGALGIGEHQQRQAVHAPAYPSVGRVPLQHRGIRGGRCSPPCTPRPGPPRPRPPPAPALPARPRCAGSVTAPAPDPPHRQYHPPRLGGPARRGTGSDNLVAFTSSSTSSTKPNQPAPAKIIAFGATDPASSGAPSSHCDGR